MDMEIKDFDKLSGFRIQFTKDLVFKGTISAIVGMILGIMCSLIVNCTLVEVSLSRFFSMKILIYNSHFFDIISLFIVLLFNLAFLGTLFVLQYFGILFIVVGIIIFWRLNANAIDEAENRKNQLMILAGLVLILGHNNIFWSIMFILRSLVVIFSFPDIQSSYLLHPGN
ncbi:hypothetical protein [Plasmodium yoelii yoelii]|uniref:Uncharacterized protein n=1 Tax=Plasmodium yoelii yoelii TaxID=73239 RepID=Q7RL03_PLAYO|nr:hypothetical protein [Plasmodium yoelii yoelii]